MNQRHIFSLRTVITLTCLVGLSTISSRALAQDCDGNGVPDAIDLSGALYVTDSANADIYRVPLTGGVPQLVYDGSNFNSLYSGLAIDKANGTMYIVNGASDWIYKANIDGTSFNGNFLAATGDVRNDISMRVPGQFYYTHGNCVNVYPSGSAPGGCGLQFPYVIDTVTESSYVIYGISSGEIQLIINNGGPSNQIRTIVTNVPIPGGIAYHNNQVFWTELSTGFVRRADISCDANGCTADLNVTTIFTTGASDPLGIAADHQNNKIFFIDDIPRRIWQCNPDGSGLIPFASMPPGTTPLALDILPASSDCNNNGVIDECDPDCNGDGVPDECELDAGATNCNSNSLPDSCEIATAYSSPLTISTESGVDVVSADLDGDGDNDAAWVSSSGAIAWAENTNGIGTFGAAKTISNSGNNPLSVYAADLDGDADPDLIVAYASDNEVVWYQNRIGEGGADADGFGPAMTITTLAASVRSVFASDVDGDGDADVLSASSNDGKIAWYENTDGLGNFGPQQTIDGALSWANQVRTADLDNDGDQDVLAAASLGDIVVWYMNTDGLGSFGPRQTITQNVDLTQSIDAADLDGDNDLDVLSASSSDGKIAWYENTDGLGSFGSQRIIHTSSSFPDFVATGDLDGDGDRDVLLSSSSASMAYCINTDGQGTFSAPQTIVAGSSFMVRAIATNINGDGSLDILATLGEDVFWLESLTGDCDGNGILDACEFAGGSAIDCNSNSLPDACDIAAGISPDCNTNGIPDECELAGNDCNANGILDDCELLNNDCNDNGVIDECEFGATDCNANGVFDGCDLTPTYDQINTPPGGVGAINIQSPREQTFRPFTDVLAGFDIGLVPGFQNLAGDTLSVGVYRNAVLLEETAQFVPAEFVGMFTFLLPAPVPVTPGETLSLIVQGGTFLEFSWQYTSIDSYPFGHRIHAGSPNGDFVFRTIELAPASQDCNANGIPDDCELAGNDCNNDGIPDECQLMPDCNSNGIPDDCELAGNDCNSDGIPDECQLNLNDCNADGIPDDCNLATSDCNNNGTVDECEFEAQIDQSYLPPWTGGAGNIFQGNRAGQTFRPTFTLIEAIDVALLDNLGSGSDQLTLILLRGAVEIGSVTRTVSVPSANLERFTFAAPIATTPGETLEFQLEDTGSLRFFWKLQDAGYADGQGTFLGNIQPYDHLFQTLGRDAGWMDCNQNGVPDDCEVLAGDCNNNGLLDDCEGLPDCNQDGVPDECQIDGNDCNGDGVLDACQLAADCNANGVPDACEINGGAFAYGAAPNLAIPDTDPAGVQSVISIPAAGAVSDVNVNLHITHTWQGDVVATLSHNGTTVTLINHSGASSVGCTGNAFGYESDNFGSEGDPLVLDDSAPVSIDCYNGPASTIAVNNYAGPAMPNEPLAAFSGMDLSGDWILTVSDPFAQEVGTLVSWSLDIETTGTDCNANGVLDACESSGGFILAMDDLNDEIVPLNEDGSSAGPSIPLPGGVYRAIAVDRQLGKIHYGNISTNQIYRVNLDGTGTELLVDASAGRAITIEMDAVNDRIYWVGSSSIYRSFRDGSGVELLVTSLTGASGLDLDVAGGRMYFTEQSAGRIKSANLDGSDVQTLINSGLTSPVEIAVDPAGGKFYFTQFDGLVRRANLDGSGLEDIYAFGANCAGIQLDLADGKVYFSDVSPDEILRMNLDGSGLESVANVANAYRFFLSPFSADCNGNGILDECETGPLGCGPGEECDAAAQVTEGVMLGSLADNLGTTGNDDSCGGANNTIDEWLEFTPGVSTLATFTTCNPGTEFDSVLAVFDGCPQTGGTQLACNDDTVGAPPECGLGGSNLNRKSTIHLDVISGQAYLIRVSVYNDSFAVQGGFGPNYELSIDLCSKGDLNGDDLVDLFDVPLFVDALLDPATATPDAACGADMNDDGQVNGLDTQLFTNALMSS